MVTSCRFFLLSFFFLVITFANVQAQHHVQPEVEELNQGIELFNQGLYEQAANEFEEFLKQKASHELDPSARFYLVRSRARIDSLNRHVYYETFIREYPHSDFTTRLLFEMANRQKDKGNYEEAISTYQRALNLGANEGEAVKAFYWMGEAAAKEEKYEAARDYYMTVADKFPQSEWAPKALYARGRLYLSENNYDASTRAFEILKKRYPNNEMTRRIGTALGESYYQQGRYKEAIEAFKNAMPHLDSELRSKAVYLIAESYNYLNNFDEASQYYLQHININKGSDEVRISHYGLGWVYHKQEIYHWAADEFAKAAKGSDELARKALYYKAVNEKLGSRYAEAMLTFREFGERFQEGLWVEEAYYEWAVTAYEMGNYSETIEVLLPLVRREESLKWQGKIYTLLGEAYFANQEYTRALQAFDAAEKVTNIDPSIKRQARFQKAWVQYSNQAFEQAQPIFEALHQDAPQTEIGKEALFWSADAYYQMQEFGPAATRYEQFIQQNKDHELVGPATYALGWSNFKMGDYENAIGPLTTFLTEYEPPEVALYPYETDTQLRIGDSYYALGDYQNAIAQYQKAIGAEPGGDYAMFQVANSHYRNERTYEAVTTFRRFLRIYPYSRLREQAQYNIAYIYLNTGNYSQAVKEFQTVINKYPNTSWAARSQYNIGDAYYNAGEYDKAIEAYQQVMEEYPQSKYIIEAANGIQYAQYSAGETDTSTDYLEKFLAKHPQTTMADRLRFRQADNLMQSGNYSAAIDEFQQYIRITNNQEMLPDAHYNLASAYEQKGQTKEAIQQYQVVVDQYPDSERAATALAALGQIANEQENYQQSFDYYKQLAQKSDQYRLEAYIGMGNALLAMGNPDQAKNQYQEALNIEQGYDPANVGLAKVALENGNTGEAEKLLGEVAENNTTDVGAEAQYLLGVTYQRQNKYRQAIEAFSNVNILYEAYDEWIAKALLEKAKSHIQLGQTGEARSALNTLIENYPDRPQAQEANRLLNSN